MKRERFKPWKVLKHIEEPGAMSSQERTRTLAVCGSSIAHRECVYAGDVRMGVPQCEARVRIWNECPFACLHTKQIAAERDAA